MKLLGSTKNKITKDENGENVPYLEITEVVLMHLFLINCLVNCWIVNLIKLYFQKHLVQNFHILKCGLQINFS